MYTSAHEKGRAIRKRCQPNRSHRPVQRGGRRPVRKSLEGQPTAACRGRPATRKRWPRGDEAPNTQAAGEPGLQTAGGRESPSGRASKPSRMQSSTPSH